MNCCLRGIESNLFTRERIGSFCEDWYALTYSIRLMFEYESRYESGNFSYQKKQKWKRLVYSFFLLV